MIIKQRWDQKLEHQKRFIKIGDEKFYEKSKGTNSQNGTVLNADFLNSNNSYLNTKNIKGGTRLDSCIMGYNTSQFGYTFVTMILDMIDWRSLKQQQSRQEHLDEIVNVLVSYTAVSPNLKI